MIHGTSKASRRNTAEQHRNLRRDQAKRDLELFSDPGGAPRLLALVTLSSEINISSIQAEIFGNAQQQNASNSKSMVSYFYDKHSKQRIAGLTSVRELLPVLDICRSADVVCFVVSEDQHVDELGTMILRAVEAQGVGDVKFAIQGSPLALLHESKQNRMRSIRDYASRYFPGVDRVYNLALANDRRKLLNSCCARVPKVVNWRAERSWMLVDRVEVATANADPVVEPTSEASVVLRGHLRGQALNLDHLVLLGEFGPFEIESVELLDPLPTRARSRYLTSIQTPPVGHTGTAYPSAAQESLTYTTAHPGRHQSIRSSSSSIARLQSPQSKGVKLDDHYYFSDASNDIPKRPVRVPRGTSAYQAAWLLDDEYISDLDEDPAADSSIVVADEHPSAPKAVGDDPETLVKQFDGVSEADVVRLHDQLSPGKEAEALAIYRDSRKQAADEDRFFPDEIELRPGERARDRLMKYRGLRSLNASIWDQPSDEAYRPEIWDQLCSASKLRSLRARSERVKADSGFLPGSQVRIRIRNVPTHVRHSLQSENVLFMSTLLPGEDEHSACNVKMTLNPDCPRPIVAKEQIIMQCGQRRMIIEPLFSEDGTPPNKVHRFERFLRPGQTTVVSYIGPVHLGPAEALFFLQSDSPLGLTFIGSGANLLPSLDRVIVKRIVLTGHPYRIHKQVATIRYMFFNAEDVVWFQALQLWTKTGRIGHIKESLGTHGYFKAIFDGKLNPLDTIAISLYKRLWPKQAKPLHSASRLIQPPPADADPDAMRG